MNDNVVINTIKLKKEGKDKIEFETKMLLTTFLACNWRFERL